MATSRTWEQRRAAGLDAMATLLGTPVDEAGAREREQAQGPLSTWAIDHVLGDVWNRPQLSRRDRSMIVLAFLITLRCDDELRVHTRGALHHGVTVEEIHEIVHQAAGYAGFPTAIASRRVIDETLAAAVPDQAGPRPLPAHLHDDERRAQAAEVLARMHGLAEPEPAELTRARMVENLGGVGEVVHDWAFGEIWPRSELSRRDRSMVTVSIIMALGGQPDQLTLHARVAREHGMTETEISEIAVQATVYLGFPRAVTGFQTIAAALSS